MHRNYADLCRERPVVTTAALGAWLYVWFAVIHLLVGSPASHVILGGSPARDLLALHGTYALLGILAIVAFNDYAHYVFTLAEERPTGSGDLRDAYR